MIVVDASAMTHAPLVACDGKFADAPRTVHTAIIDTYRDGTFSRWSRRRGEPLQN